MVVTPTLKAAEVAARETGAAGGSAAWLVHQHGWRWDDDGHWIRNPRTPDPSAQPSDPGICWSSTRPGCSTRTPPAPCSPSPTRPAPGSPSSATGTSCPPSAAAASSTTPPPGRTPPPCVDLDRVHRFTDPDYADLTLAMRTGTDPGAVFDTLHARGQIVLHASDVERTAALADVGATRRGAGDRRHPRPGRRPQRRHPRPAAAAESIEDDWTVTTGRGEHDRRRGPGRDPPQRPRPRRHQPADLDRHRHRRTTADLVVHRPGKRQTRDRPLPADYADEHVELAYATTAHGAQGETVDHAHVAIGESTGAASAYVAMTRGREAQHRPPGRRHRRATRASSGSRSSAATAPTSAPPAPASARSRTSTATDPEARPCLVVALPIREQRQTRPTPWPEDQRPEPHWLRAAPESSSDNAKFQLSGERP